MHCKMYVYMYIGMEMHNNIYCTQQFFKYGEVHKPKECHQ